MKKWGSARESLQGAIAAFDAARLLWLGAARDGRSSTGSAGAARGQAES